MVSWLAVHSTIIDGAMNGPLLCQGNCVAAVSNVYDGRRTTGVTAAIRAADGRRTTTEGKQRKKKNAITKQGERNNGIRKEAATGNYNAGNSAGYAPPCPEQTPCNDKHGGYPSLKTANRQKQKQVCRLYRHTCFLQHLPFIKQAFIAYCRYVHLFPEPMADS